MTIKSETIQEYLDQLPSERKEVLERMMDVIQKNLPNGFYETISYNMIGYVVPHSKYPNGYHCDPKLPLPFLSIASQKNFVALYHMGVYADPELYDWFVSEYPKYCKTKLDMGKSCIRFKKMDDIPYQLIGDLVSRMSPDDWISLYEANYVKK